MSVPQGARRDWTMEERNADRGVAGLTRNQPRWSISGANETTKRRIQRFEKLK